jgi:hypothetical protein
MKKKVAFVLALGASACVTTQPHSEAVPLSVSSTCSGDLSRGATIVLGPEAIAEVEPLYAGLASHGSWSSRLRGATIHFRPIVGLSEQTLEALIWCHRDAIAKGIVPALANDPYALPAERMQVKVESDGAGLMAKLSCDDIEDAKAVLARFCGLSCNLPARN